MNPIQKATLQRYVRTSRNEIDGWFSRVDAEIMLAVQLAQNERGWSGSVVEIGIHHGKSFIALCLGLAPGELAYGIDLFDDQSLNLDQSGRGSRARLEDHLARFQIRGTQVKLDARASQDVRPEDILNVAGRSRIFSIDGGHWEAVVISDLSLAESVIHEYGVIALDDFHRAEWPDVSAGYFKWKQNAAKDIVPFAIGFNKLYLCLRPNAASYRETLHSNSFLRKFFIKSSKLQGHDVLIYQSFPLPEFGFMRRIHEHLRLYHPQIYFAARTWKRKLSAR